jgi:DNA primase
MIEEQFIQELLERVDIIDVVSRHIQLEVGEVNFSAPCPFHTEITSSFVVSRERQFYHCFGCDAHGSAIGFLMRHSNLSFTEAVEELARSVGMNPRTQ